MNDAVAISRYIGREPGNTKIFARKNVRSIKEDIDCKRRKEILFHGQEDALEVRFKPYSTKVFSSDLRLS